FYNSDLGLRSLGGAGWQLLETRTADDVDPSEQYVWDIRYVDAPVVRFQNANTDGDYADAEDNVLYYTSDANMNVTALVDESGTVVERYAYDPYGERTVLDADFSADADGLSDVNNALGHQGLHLDTESALYYNRNRMYNAELGRFTTRDPLGYVDGMSVYEYVRSRPVVYRDPEGLAPQGFIEKYQKLTEWQASMGEIIEVCKTKEEWTPGELPANIKQMVTVRHSVIQFRHDIREHILGELDEDEVAELLEMARVLSQPNKAAKSAHEYLGKVRGAVNTRNIGRVERSLQKVGVNTKKLEEQVTGAWNGTVPVRNAIGTAEKLMDAASKIRSVATAPSISAKMKKLLDIALDGVGSKIPALGPMMSYYQKAIDAIFKKIEDIAWDRADNFILPHWRETCCDTGEGIILTYRWAKNYKPLSLSVAV
ncbi:MAG: hypothetical protein GVY16_07900, partial [Planctomycetes bacterium]|nr:hypothetical protein [Planctomycetota bacterium]